MITHVEIRRILFSYKLMKDSDSNAQTYEENQIIPLVGN